MPKLKRKWHIIGYNGLEKFFEIKIPEQCITYKKMEILITQLASRHLKEEEIILSSINKRNGCKGGKNLLRISREGSSMSCGENPYYVAKVIVE